MRFLGIVALNKRTIIYHVYTDIIAQYLFKFLKCLFLSAAFACNFDSLSVCGFTQDKNDKFDWTRNRGSTSSSSTGPSADHSTGSGRLTKHEL